MTPNEFVARLRPTAEKMFAQTGVPAAVVIAQAALESNYGKSLLAQKANNLFGIKAGPGWRGDAIDMETGEHIDGRDVTVRAAFRAYASWDESVRDHADFLRTNRRYRQAFITSDPMLFACAIAAAGYATDPNYATKLIALMRSRNLLDAPGPAPAKCAGAVEPAASGAPDPLPSPPVIAAPAPHQGGFWATLRRLFAPRPQPASVLGLVGQGGGDEPPQGVGARLLAYLFERAQEPSSWRGAVLLVALGAAIRKAPANWVDTVAGNPETIVGLGLFLVGLIGVFAPDRRRTP